MDAMWIPVIGIAGSFAVVIAIVYLSAMTRQQRTRARADVQMKLIERFGTANEFVSFVQSPEGKQFLGDAPATARKSGVAGIRSGIILAFIGLAFLLVAFTDHDKDWFIPAFIMLGLGGGFFVSAMFSMKLARDMEKNAGS